MPMRFVHLVDSPESLPNCNYCAHLNASHHDHHHHRSRRKPQPQATTSSRLFSHYRAIPHLDTSAHAAARLYACMYMNVVAKWLSWKRAWRASDLFAFGRVFHGSDRVAFVLADIHGLAGARSPPFALLLCGYFYVNPTFRIGSDGAARWRVRVNVFGIENFGLAWP